MLIEETIVAASKPAADEIPADATPQTPITPHSDSSDLPGDDADKANFPSSSNCDVMPYVADIYEMEFESNSPDRYMNSNEPVDPTPDEIDHQGERVEEYGKKSHLPRQLDPIHPMDLLAQPGNDNDVHLFSS